MCILLVEKDCIRTFLSLFEDTFKECQKIEQNVLKIAIKLNLIVYMIYILNE